MDGCECSDFTPPAEVLAAVFVVMAVPVVLCSVMGWIVSEPEILRTRPCAADGIDLYA